MKSSIRPAYGQDPRQRGGANGGRRGPKPTTVRGAALSNMGGAGSGRIAQEKQLWKQTMPEALQGYTRTAAYEVGLPPSQRDALSRMPVAPGEIDRTRADAHAAGQKLGKLEAMKRLGLVDAVTGEPTTESGHLARHMQRALAKNKEQASLSVGSSAASAAAAAAGVPAGLLPGAGGTPEETLPRLMQSLRTRLAEEVYLVTESLFTVVEADFREGPRDG